jgi:hypothetical protein
MGVMTFITLEKPIRGLKDDLGGKGLARYSFDLDEIAASLSIQPLDAFLSCSAEQYADLVGDRLEAPEKWKGFKEEWFSASEGLEVVQRLLGHLRMKPIALALLPVEWQETVLLDLETAARILQTAEKHGVRFHFTCAC